MANIFELFIKAIEEHGSAAILMKHLDFVKEQYAALEKKNLELVEGNRALTQHSSTLEGENAFLKEQIVQLNEKIKNIQNSGLKQFPII
jgi:small-conductance mechanosensitive channel